MSKINFLKPDKENLSTFLLNNFLKETYSSRKLEIEESIENLLDKDVDLGDYVGI